MKTIRVGKVEEYSDDLLLNQRLDEIDIEERTEKNISSLNETLDIVVGNLEEKINLVVQINGKKRALLKLMPNIKEDELFEIIGNDETLKKYLDNKTIKRKIFIKDKLFNIIV